MEPLLQYNNIYDAENDLASRILSWQRGQENNLPSPTSLDGGSEWRKRKYTMANPSRSSSPRKRRRALASDGIFDSDSDGDGNEDIDATITRQSFAAAIPNLHRGSTTTQSNDSSPPRTRTTQSRASSPSKGGNRQKRIALRLTSPTFVTGFLRNGPAEDEAGPHRVPTHIASLIRSLSESAAAACCLSAELRSRIDEYSHSTEYLPDDVGEDTERGGGYPEFGFVRSIYESAFKIYRTHSDEQAWYPVVRSILQTAAKDGIASMVEVDESQTKSVCSELLPLLGNNPISTVKTDFLLQFNPDHQSIAQSLITLLRRKPGLSLSAFNDPVSSTTFTAALVEVKAPGGDFDEGVYQFSVAAAGVLARLRHLSISRAEEPYAAKAVMPVVGWVIHGHFWYLHVAYEQSDNLIRVLGPFPSGNTATLVGICRLLHIIARLEEWITSHYWPFLKGIVQMNL